MRITTILLFIFCITCCFGQNGQLAEINDPDGYVNVREGKSSDSKIAGKIKEGEYFFAEETKEEWVKVWIERPYGLKEFGNPSYVHHSRVQYLHQLSLSEQKKLFQSFFISVRNDRAISNRLHEKYDYQKKHWISKTDSLNFFNHCKNRKEIQPMMVYGYLLNLFSDYYAKTGDSETYTIFAEAIYEDMGSALEAIIWNTGKCFISRPELTRTTITGLPENIRIHIQKQTINGIYFHLNSHTDKETFFIYGWIEGFVYGDI